MSADKTTCMAGVTPGVSLLTSNEEYYRTYDTSHVIEICPQQVHGYMCYNLYVACYILGSRYRLGEYVVVAVAVVIVVAATIVVVICTNRS